jgi:hypothetical protein
MAGLLALLVRPGGTRVNVRALQEVTGCGGSLRFPLQLNAEDTEKREDAEESSPEILCVLSRFSASSALKVRERQRVGH